MSDLGGYFEEDDEDELLKEIETERKLQAEKVEAAKISASQSQTGLQLSAFQEEIITTGSGVATIILYILALLFVVRALQILYQRLSKMSKLNKIKSVLSEAKTVAAHKVGGWFKRNESISGNYKITYCAEFEMKAIYEETLILEPTNINKLKKLLVERAKELLIRGEVLNRDSVGMHQSFNRDMVPMKVWNDFNQAKALLESEMKLIQLECQAQDFKFGKHEGNILAYANELLEHDAMRTSRYAQIRSGKARSGGKPLKNGIAPAPTGPRRRKGKRRFPRK